MLTANEIQFLLELISIKYGHGYAPKEAKGVGGLQAKLSVMAELAARTENVGEPLDDPRVERSTEWRRVPQ